MLKLLFIIIFIFSLLLCNAQQSVMFLNYVTKKQEIYTLPRTVICVTASGKNKRLILTKITGDTLHFDDIKDKNQSYYSKFSNIKSIRFLSNWDGVNSLLVAGSGSIAFVSAFLTIDGLKNEDSFAQGAAIVLIPICIVSSICTFGFNSLISKEMSPKSWKMYVKDLQNHKVLE
ncbi:MAG: hypothetical protein ACOYMA_13160 [Bacteroidia bacterium]